MPMMAMTTNNSTSVNAWRTSVGNCKPCSVLPSSYGWLIPSLALSPSHRGQVSSPRRTTAMFLALSGLSGLA